VLQEQSTRPITDPELFYAYARELDDVIAEAGARTAFFMTWAYQNDPGMIETLADAYAQIGAELGAPVAPVGLAWDRSRREDPDLNLYGGDGSHPNPHGTYLTACVFFALLWGQDPTGNPYSGDPSISDADREFLQRIAWETVSDYTACRFDDFRTPAEGCTPGWSVQASRDLLDNAESAVLSLATMRRRDLESPGAGRDK
jgi:hypothetical protein